MAAVAGRPGVGGFGLAAQAGAVAGGWRLGEWGRADVFAGRAAAGAAGLAEDFSGLDGVDELAVGAGVAREDLLPGFAGEDAGDLS